jgi:hypothetical protein
LKEELESEGLTTRMIFPRIPMPPTVSEPCPDMLRNQGTGVSEDKALEVLNAYDECRLKHEAMVKFVAGLDRIAKDMQEEQDKELGLPETKKGAQTESQPKMGN